MRLRINHKALASYALLFVSLGFIIAGFIIHPVAALLVMISTFALIYAVLGVAIAVIASHKSRDGQ